MIRWKIVFADGIGEGSVDTLASDVTVVETTTELVPTVTTLSVRVVSSDSNGGSGRVVAGFGLIGIGAAVVVAWGIRALRSV